MRFSTLSADSSCRHRALSTQTGALAVSAFLFAAAIAAVLVLPTAVRGQQVDFQEVPEGYYIDEERVRPDWEAPPSGLRTGMNRAAREGSQSPKSGRVPITDTRSGPDWEAAGPAPTLDGQVENVTPDNSVSGAIHTVVAHPTSADILWVGAVNGGIWKTENATTAFPVWTPLTDKLPSLAISALELDPLDLGYNTLVAGTGSYSSFAQQGGAPVGLYRTTDGGLTWTWIGATEIGGNYVSAVAPRGAIIVAGLGGIGSGIGIARSTDEGASFALVQDDIDSGLPANSVFDIVGVPGNGNANILFAALADSFEDGGPEGGIFKSTDTGATWTRVSSAGLEDDIVGTTNNIEMTSNYISSTQNAVYVGIMNFGVLARVWYTLNGGASWLNMEVPTTNEGGSLIGVQPRPKAGAQGAIHFSILADNINRNLVYVGGDRQPVGGDGGFPNSIGAFNFSGRLFRGDRERFIGSQWQHLTHNSTLGAFGGGTLSNSSPHADSREMTFDANGNIIETDDGGIYRRTGPRTNTGDWIALNSGLQVAEIHSIAYDPLSRIVLAGAQDTGTPEQIATGQTTFRSVSQGDGGDVAVDARAFAGQGISLRYSSFQNFGSFRRRAIDTNNNVISTEFPDLDKRNQADRDLQEQFVTPIEINVLDPSRILIGGANGVFETFDRGEEIIPLEPESLFVTAMVSGGTIEGFPVVDLIWAGGVASDDTGTTPFLGLRTVLQIPDPEVEEDPPLIFAPLTQVTTYPGAFPVDVVCDPNDFRRVYVADQAGALHESLDAGLTWVDISWNLSDDGGQIRSLEYMPIERNDEAFNILLAGTDSGVYYRQVPAIGGQVWAPFGERLPVVPAWDMDLDSNSDTLVVGTLGRGAWKFERASEFDCRYSITETEVNFSFFPGSDSVDITTTLPNCGWTAQVIDNAPWLTITSPSAGQVVQGSGTVGLSVELNTGPPRQARVQVDDLIITVFQNSAEAECIFDISPLTLSAAVTGEVVSFTVSSNFDQCSTSVTPNDPWISVNPPSVVTGSGTVQLTIAPSDSATPRTGTVSVGGKTVTIIQSGLSDAFEPDNTRPTAKRLLPGASQGRSIFPAGDVDWVYFDIFRTSEVRIETSGPIGNSQMGLFTEAGTQIEFNDDTQPGFFSKIDRLCGIDPLGPGRYLVRINNFDIRETVPSYTLSLTVTSCADCPVTVTPTTIGFTGTGGTGLIDVGDPAACGWGGVTTDDWITIQTGASSGNGVLQFSVTPYNGTERRTGAIYILDQVVTVVQGPNDDRFEDNDIPTAATQVAAGIGGTRISNLVLRDEDWYAIQLPKHRHVKIRAEFRHAEGNLNMQFWDFRSANNSFGHIEAESYSVTDNEELTYVNLTDPQTMYLRVYGEEASPNQVYELVIEGFNIDDAFDLAATNNVACDASTATVATPYSNLILRNEDWYRVNVEGLDNLNIRADFPFFSGNLHMMVVGPGPCETPFSRVIAGGFSDEPGNNFEEVNGIDVTGLGEVFIRVFGAIRDTNFYNIAITSGNQANAAPVVFEAVEAPVSKPTPASSVAPTPRLSRGNGEDSYEGTTSNNNQTLASPIAIGASPVELTDLFLADEDWYALQVGRLVHLRITATFQHAEQDLQLQLWDARSGVNVGDPGHIVSESYSTTNEEVVNYVNLTDPGTIYLRVYSESGYDSPSFYTLDIEPTFIDDTFDTDGFVNNFPCDVAAQSLALGVYNDLIAKDEDWFAFDVSGVDAVNIRADHRFFSGNLHLMVANGDPGCGAVYSNLIAGGFSNNPANNFEEILNVNVQGIDRIYIRVYGAIRDRNYYDLSVTDASN